MTLGKKMKPLDDEIERIDAEIARLQIERSALMRLKTRMIGPSEVPPPVNEGRRRSANIKPLILDTMRERGPHGATSNEVAAIVRERVPTVAKDTVGSILSRLKADGALVHDGERYFDAKFAPKPEPRPFEPKVVHG